MDLMGHEYCGPLPAVLSSDCTTRVDSTRRKSSLECGFLRSDYICFGMGISVAYSHPRICLGLVQANLWWNFIGYSVYGGSLLYSLNKMK